MYLTCSWRASPLVIEKQASKWWNPNRGICSVIFAHRARTTQEHTHHSRSRPLGTVIRTVIVGLARSRSQSLFS